MTCPARRSAAGSAVTAMSLVAVALIGVAARALRSADDPIMLLNAE